MRHTFPAGTGSAAIAAALACLILATGARAEEADLAKKVDELQRRMQAMKKKHDQELVALRKRLDEADAARDRAGLAAEVESYLKEGAPQPKTEETFTARGLGQQALNPEISAIGDMLTGLSSRKGEPPEGEFTFRSLDLHVQAYLDPYSLMKAVIGFGPDGADLEEAYFTRFGLFDGLNVTIGRFRQQFGVVNRWHEHALDQVEYPLAIKQLFGDEGLTGTGLSFEYRLPAPKSYSHVLILQVARGENDRLFSENSRNLPAILLRYRNYRDFSKDTYFEIGITGMVGWNDSWELTAGTVHDRRATWLGGVDWTVRWEPTERMRYANMEWRTEFYGVDRGFVADTGEDSLFAWGGYTSLQRRVSRTVDIGLRVDFFVPDQNANAPAPLAVAGPDPYRWHLGPYVTWHQSPWVRMRVELGYTDGNRTGPAAFNLVFQIVFAAGPHKHDRY